jgi:uncharacterized damage-inducible protein DinB
MKARYEMFAAYNRWANERIYDAAAKLSDMDYRADRGAFFKSVHGTLNHMVVGDLIWMRRFTGTGDSPSRLDAILYDEFPKLRAAREAEDERIVQWVAGLTDEKSPRPSIIAPWSTRRPSSSRSDRRWIISSTIRRITAASSIAS